MVKKHFTREVRAQNYLMFQPDLEYFKPILFKMVMLCRSKCLPNENIIFATRTGSSLFPTLNYFKNPKFQIEFNESSLRPNRVTFVAKK